jgi:hypothetical protein
VKSAGLGAGPSSVARAAASGLASGGMRMPPKRIRRSRPVRSILPPLVARAQQPLRVSSGRVRVWEERQRLGQARGAVRGNVQDDGTAARAPCGFPCRSGAACRGRAGRHCATRRSMAASAGSAPTASSEPARVEGPAVLRERLGQPLQEFGGRVQRVVRLAEQGEVLAHFGGDLRRGAFGGDGEQRLHRIKKGPVAGRGFGRLDSWGRG